MIEPLTAANTVASIGAQVLKVLNYVVAVHDAPTRARQMRTQLQTAVQLADHIEQLLAEKPQMPVGSLPDAMSGFRQVLQNVSSRIGDTSMSKVQRLAWPFTEQETDRLFSDIEHYKSSFNTFFSVQNLYDPLS